MSKLEKYFSQFTNKELEDNFSELVRKYNEKEKSEPRNVESAFFYPIKVGSSVISESNFQDYKNDIERRISEGIEIQAIRDFYQKKVIDKFLSDKRLSEIYEKIKVGEPIKNPPFSNIVKKWSFWSNVHRVQDIIELENFLKESPLQQPETDKTNEVTTKHPKHNPNYWNTDCFELFKYLYDEYYKGTKRQLTNIWFYLKEYNNQKYILSITKDLYKDFIIENYGIVITNFDKAQQKWEDTEYRKLDEHRQNFEDGLK